ncbi:unnamed protein product [Calypogeia fissa]
MGGTGAAAGSSSATTTTMSSSTTTTTSAAGASSSSGGGGAGRSSSSSSWTRDQQQQRGMSVVEDQGVYSSTCGYCKASSRSSVAQGLWAYRLTVQDYQELLDRGWRRSGMFLYKPHMKRTCCPPYTIRLKADSFVATKDQMRVLRRMQRYLERKLDGLQTVGELQEEKGEASERGKGLPSDNHVASGSDRNHFVGEPMPVDVQPSGHKDVAVTEAAEILGRLKAATEAALRECVECGSLPVMDLPDVSVKRVPQKVKGKLKATEGEVDYTSSISFAVMALLKRRAKTDTQGNENMAQKAVISDMKPEEIAEMLVGKMSQLQVTNSFRVRACKGHINFVLPAKEISNLGPLAEETGIFLERKSQKKTVYSKKQPSSLEQPSLEPAAIMGTLEVRMKRSSFDAEEFALYKKYQVRVHNDRPEDVKEGSYRRFLVDTPLIFVPPKNNGSTPSCGFGSFHQQYWLDGKLVAVGVIDILPYCLSSKYLFWDPDFAFLALGKYSALQEIKWVQEAQKVCSSLQYYYLGFYIHSCPKMRYKAAYYPSELLCPERFSWVPYEVSVPFLDKQAYVCLSDLAHLQSTSAESSIPRIASEQRTGATSVLDSDEEDNAMETEADFSEFEDQEKVEASLDLLLEKSVLRSSSNSTGPLGSIQLYVNGGCISFKQLQDLALVPQWHLDTLVHNLNRYLQVVGPALASRMAYALS